MILHGRPSQALYHVHSTHFLFQSYNSYMDALMSERPASIWHFMSSTAYRFFLASASRGFPSSNDQDGLLLAGLTCHRFCMLDEKQGFFEPFVRRMPTMIRRRMSPRATETCGRALRSRARQNRRRAVTECPPTCFRMGHGMSCLAHSAAEAANLQNGKFSRSR